MNKSKRIKIVFYIYIAIVIKVIIFKYPWEDLKAIMDTWEDTCTIPVTVFAWQENGGWKLHVDDDFVNAFMGNLNRGTYSDEIEQRLAQLEEEYADKVAEWE